MNPDLSELRAQLAELRHQLEEAEETIHAIRNGEVDAFLIDDAKGERVYTLESADRPYRTLVEHMQQGALVLSSDGTILFGNGRFSEFVQTPLERLPGELLAGFVRPDQRACVEALLREGLVGKAVGELALRRADGGHLAVHITVSPLPLGTSASLCVIITDLTERREHEEVVRMQSVLKEADRRKDEFLATLAHELRNPLAPMRTAAEILRLKAPPLPEVRMAQDIMDRQIDQMTRLVDDLLDLSRITRNHLVLRPEQIELTSVVHAAVETSLPVINKAGHQLVVELPPERVVLRADLTRLSQVFANLLNNAAKYTNRGGRIAVRATVRDGGVSVSIQDNGVGIPDDLLPRVFDMFTQVDRSLDRSESGLGIGLTLAKRLVEMHGGTIDARSEVGKGSEFIVHLPAAIADASEAPAVTVAKSNGSDRTATSLRILAVDNNVDSADAQGALLRLLGHDVRTAYDGESALQIGRTFEPHVVLLDIGMPGLDGHETCRQLRRERWGKQTRVVAVTGWGQREDRRRTNDSGFDYHLVKPVEPAALMALLQHLADGRGPARHPDPTPVADISAPVG